MTVGIQNNQSGYSEPSVKHKLVDWEVYICGNCFYKYDELIGDEVFGIPPKTVFERLPMNFRCPNCNAPKTTFFPAHCIGWA